ncbi:MAG: hypothetical protein E7049_02710 [Lentisphaerae bacterium]|nr:hypothetical protein [Lentisphaerota bacterium]
MKRIMAILAAAGAACAAFGGLTGLDFSGFSHPVINNLDGNTISAGEGGMALKVGEGIEMDMDGGTIDGDMVVSSGAKLYLGEGIKVVNGGVAIDSTAQVSTASEVEISSATGGGSLTLGTNAWVYAYGESVSLAAVAGCVLKFEGTGATAVVDEGADGGLKWLDEDAVAEGRPVEIVDYVKDGTTSWITFKPNLDGKEGHTTMAWFKVSIVDNKLVKVRYAKDIDTIASGEGEGLNEEYITEAAHAAEASDETIWFKVEHKLEEGVEPPAQFFRIVVE